MFVTVVGIILCVTHCVLEFCAHYVQQFDIYTGCMIFKSIFWVFSITMITWAFHLFNEMKSTHKGYNASMFLIIIPTFALLVDIMVIFFNRLHIIGKGNSHLNLSDSHFVFYGVLTCIEAILHRVNNYLQTLLLLHATHFVSSNLKDNSPREYAWYQMILLNLVFINVVMWIIDSLSEAGHDSLDYFVTSQILPLKINEGVILCITSPLSTFNRFHAGMNFFLLRHRKV